MDITIERDSAVTFIIPDERSIIFRPTSVDTEWVLELDKMQGYGSDDRAVGLVRAVVLGGIAGGLKNELVDAFQEGMSAFMKAERLNRLPQQRGPDGASS